MCSPGVLFPRSLPEYRTDHSSPAVPTEGRSDDLGINTVDCGEAGAAWAAGWLGLGRATKWLGHKGCESQEKGQAWTRHHGYERMF